MKIRNLYNGVELNESEIGIDLSIVTKVPEKWLLIDLEKLQLYRGTNSSIITKRWQKQEIHSDFIFKSINDIINEK
jgi:hypothetical protein